MAVEIEFRLVPYDHPEVTVETLQRERPVTEPVTTSRGTEFQQIGLDLVCWSRNVLLDGQPLFERYHDGKYIDRFPRAKRPVNPGKHIIWPGEHAFTVAPDGSLTSGSLDLLLEKGLVRIKSYPVTVRAFNANDDSPTAEAAPLPNMTVRDAAELEAKDVKNAPKPHDLLPSYERFAPLTVWLPASQNGKGYVLHPMGLSFRLGAQGIVPSEEGGAIPGVKIRDWAIEIPLYSYPITGAAGCSAVVQGVEKLAWPQPEAGRAKHTNWYPRREAYELRVSDTGPAILADGGLLAMPVKSMRVDMADRAKGVQRAVLVELAGSHYHPGEKAKARVQVCGSAAPAGEDAGTTAPEEVFGRLQQFEGGAWTELAISSAENGAITFALPNATDDVYRLRLGIRAKDMSSEISADTLITLAGESKVALGVFTQRGRSAFFRGESFWIGLGALVGSGEIAAGSPLQVDLVGPDERRLNILKEKLAGPVNRRETFIVRLDERSSQLLAAGEYRIEAKLGGFSSRPKRIAIVDPQPRTHFTNLLVGKYNVLGEQYEKVIHTGEGADELARTIVALGYNGFMGMSYDMNRVMHPRAEIERLVRQRPELGPWESYQQSSGRDRFLDACVRYNLPFWENMLTYNDTSLPREEKIISACERFAGLEVSSLRYNPAFRGICLYDEIYSRSLNDNSSVVAAFERAHEMSYRELNPGMTSAKAIKALERFVGRPAGQRPYEDLAAFRTWPAHEDRAWRVFSARLAGAAKEVMPGSFNFVLNRYFGGNGSNLSVFGKEEELYAPLDAAACVMYKDGGSGDRPVFAPMQADVMRVAPASAPAGRDAGATGATGIPVWTQLHNFHASGLYGAHLLRQAFFALSQKVEGFTYFTIEHDQHSPQYADNRETARAIAGTLCTRYGDFFLSLQKGYGKVAIYYSRDADYLGMKKTNNLRCQCEGLWVACMRAGFPADFLRDGDIRAGRGMTYDVIFAPGFQFEEECPPETLAALKRLLGAGKTLAVERSSKLPLDGLTRLESELDEYDDKLGGAFPKFIDFESEMVWDRTEETTKLVHDFLAKRIPPAARWVAPASAPAGRDAGTTAGPTIGPDWLRCGDGQYMVIPNFSFTGFTGLYKTLYQAPECVTLSFPKRPPVCYDVLEMRRVDVKSEGDSMTLAADMRHYPGKIYAFLPAAVESLSLKVSAGIRAGETLRFEACALDSAGKRIEASFPIEIKLTDPAGTVRMECFRAASPVFSGTYMVPVNAAAGTWTLRTCELISGAAAEARISVQAAEANIAAALDTRKVFTQDAPRIRAFLKQKPMISIPLSERQTWARPIAEKLQGELTRRGGQAQVVLAVAAMHMPGRWDQDRPVLDGSRLWRGDVVLPETLADAPLILLGKRGENPFIDALIGRDALATLISEAFPGPGRALVCWTRRAFCNEHDTVCVLAEDEAGLSAGVAELLTLFDSTAENKISAGLTPQPPSLEGKGEPKERKDAETRGHGDEEKKRVGGFGDSIAGEDMVRCLDVDAKTGRALIGTFGYGHNLFCLDANGKALWKVFLPEHDVYFAKWYDEGRRAITGTSRGASVFLLDGQDGKVLRKFASTEWLQTHYNEGAVDTAVHIEINSALKTILIGGMTGLMAVDYDGKRQWFYDRAEAIVAIPKEADPGAQAAAFGNSVVSGNVALSPDGSKIVYGEYEVCGSTVDMKRVVDVWAFRPKVLDARSGAVLLTNIDDPGNKTDPHGWSVSWPKGSENPFVHVDGTVAPLLPDGKLGERVVSPGRKLGDGHVLIAAPTSVAVLNEKKQLWRAEGMPVCIPELDVLDEPAGRLYRSDEDGGIHCLEVKSGKTLWTARQPFCSLLAPAGTEAGATIVAGGLDGTISALSADGKPRWTVRLRELHEMPKSDYAGYVDAARRRDVDSTGELFHVNADAKGEYDKILRMGIEQFDDFGFEGAAVGVVPASAPAGRDAGTTPAPAWTAGEGQVRYSDQAHGGQRALSLPAGQRVTQKLSRRIVPSGTYLLEFFYRTASMDAKLIAGAQLRGEKGESEGLTVSTFRGRPNEWTFGRLAIKAMAATKQMEIGFESAGGEVLVDDASLKAVRFPSANLLACEELHAIEPTFVRDIRVRYAKIPPALESRLMSRNRVAAYKQGQTDTATLYTEEQAFLHNGRLDDAGPMWTYTPEAMGFSVVLTQPAWVSHLVLYLNNSTPENVYQTLSIVANDLDTKIPKNVALVRNNQRRFIVVHFEKPLRTDSLKILPGHQPRAHRDCLTEIEVYGPLGGPDQDGSSRRFPDDPNGWPMFMGCPSHAPKDRPADLTGTFAEQGRLHFENPAFFAGAIAAQELCGFGDANGAIRTMKLPALNDPKARLNWGPTWTLGTLTPTTTPAWFSGRLLAGCADGKLHAVSNTGAQLWAFQSESRTYSSPVPVGEDVYFGSDDGKLYKVDVDSGILVWEFSTGGAVRGAPAFAGGRVFVPSWDGFLYAVEAETGHEAWKAPIAKFTRASAAVADGKVYLGDEAGKIHCFDAASGRALWSGELGGRIVACPLVTEAGAVYVSEDGRVGLAGDGGALKWSRKLEGAVKGQPLATQSQILVPTSSGLEVLRTADGKADERVRIPAQLNVIAAIPYGSRVCVITASAGSYETQGRNYVKFEGAAVLWGPQAAGGGR
ncbi:MAG TPA: PQQ-binding-like beta-propeller repeat protein [Planctomycetota bacterium]